MAKLTRKEVERIIKRDAPGHRVVEYPVKDDSVTLRVRSDEGTPDLSSLKRKYGGPEEAAAAIEGGQDAGAGENEPEDQLVAIEPEAPPNPWDHGSKPKVVLISGKDKKIIASQG